MPKKTLTTGKAENSIEAVERKSLDLRFNITYFLGIEFLNIKGNWNKHEQTLISYCNVPLLKF